MLKDGIYERVINKELNQLLNETEKVKQVSAIDKAEASKILSKYMTEVVEKGLDNIIDNGGDIYIYSDILSK